jgi:DNA helicase-2/ATP-dependent DNA helicase PcrA
VVQLLARETLTIAGNPNQVLSLNEPYPYPQGLDEFSSLPGDLVEIELSQTLRSPQRIVALDNSLLLADSEDASPLVAFEGDTPLGEVSLLKWATPDDEIAGIGRFIEQRLSESDGALNPEDVFIVVPNGAWGRAFAKQLARLHIKTSSLLSNRLISGNPREEKTSLDMRAYTLLNLLADPEDIVAWRSWCGYDDYLANSVQWTRLGELARENGQGLIETLEQLSQADLPDSPIEDVVDAYRAGKRIIGNCGEKNGAALLSALEKNGVRFSREFEALLAPLTDEDTAAQLYSRIAQRVLEPQFPSANAVRIGVAASTQGLEAKLVIFVGMINGFTPSGAAFDEMVELVKRERIRREERLQVYNAAAIASESLVFSYFQKEALERAEPLKMEIKRIKAERGVRMAMLTPSVFFDEMGSSLPGAVTLVP